MENFLTRRLIALEDEAEAPVPGMYDDERDQRGHRGLRTIANLPPEPVREPRSERREARARQQRDRAHPFVLEPRHQPA